LPRSPAGEISRVSINEEKLSEKALAALEKYGAVIFEGTASVISVIFKRTKMEVFTSHPRISNFA